MILRFAQSFNRLSLRGVRAVSIEDTMERGRGRSRGRGGGGGRGGGRGRGGRPPAGLKGREIGLYYAKKSMAKRDQKERNERAVVRIDRKSEADISQVLSDLQDQTSTSSLADDMVVDGATPFMTVSSHPLITSLCSANDEQNQRLLDELTEKEKRPSYQNMKLFREMLPSWASKEKILEMIDKHQVVVISGETGCGKTTQITQYILDDMILKGRGSQCHVICTQPRRISAISVAQRVAEERGEPLGSSVGYQIRLEHRHPRPNGSILYCTTGVAIRRLITDSLLNQCSHLILDEVHERNNSSDFLSIIVKDLLLKRPDLKLVLMSATINAELFSQYFNNAPILSIPGRVFPVQEYFLEDILSITKYRPPVINERQRPGWSRYGRGKSQWQQSEEKKAQSLEYIGSLEREGKYRSQVTAALREMDLEKIDLQLVLATLKYICLSMGDGAILVFLPGWDTISKLHDMMTSDVMFNNKSRFLILPLHSMMPTTNQREVFERPPSGVRKIVIATNIAETSITIDDVVYVVDGGHIKETTYDANSQLACLDSVWESKAAARQRKGRAGRVQPGHCYYLFTHHQHSLMAEYQLPEMLRTPLEELVLQIKVLRLGMAAPFLQKALEPPSPQAIDSAIQLLKDLNALHADEELTPLGHHLANLPVHPRIGRMILFGAIFSCLDPVLTIASALGFKEPFYIPLHKQEEADRIKKEFSANHESDHIAILNAYKGWERSRFLGNERQYSWNHFLSTRTLEMLSNMKRQFVELLYNIGFVSSTDPKDPLVNANSNEIMLIKAVLCAGLYPNVAKIVPGKRTAKLYTNQDGKVAFHPKSVNYEQPQFKSQFLIYFTKMRSSSIFIHDSTVVSPFPLLFFGGSIDNGKDGDQEVITVDKWIVFQAPGHIASLVKDLRHQLDNVLKEKIANPNMLLYQVGSDEPSSRLIQTIINLITTEDYSSQHQRLAQGKHLYTRRN